MDNIPIEGGAAVAMAGAFIFTLRWMLTRFDRALRRIEARIDGQTAALLSLHQTLVAQDFTRLVEHADDDEKHKAIARQYAEIQRSVEEVRQAVMTSLAANGNS